MVPASVGFQCPECVRQGARETRSGRAAYGGARSSNPVTTTLVLIAMNVLVWIAVRVEGGGGGDLYDRLALLPQGRCETPDGTHYYPGVPEAMCEAGGRDWLSGVSDGSLWQVVTVAFTHVDPLHLAMNMLALWFLGPMLESAVGRARFLAVYGVSALTGSAAVMLLSEPNGQTLGASGAVFGLLGALLIVSIKAKVNLQFIGTWVLLGVIFSFVGPRNVSWEGHMGGLVGGALAAAIIVFSPRGPQRSFLQWAGIAASVVLALALIALRAVALTG